MGEKYEDGICEYCGKVFKRPNKFKTEPEAYHVYGCQLIEIENIVKSKEEVLYVYELIDDVRRISKVSSFAVKIDKETGKAIKNKYYKRMIKCEELVKKLEALK